MIEDVQPLKSEDEEIDAVPASHMGELDSDPEYTPTKRSTVTRYAVDCQRLKDYEY